MNDINSTVIPDSINAPTKPTPAQLVKLAALMKYLKVSKCRKPTPGAFGGSHFRDRQTVSILIPENSVEKA